MTTTNTIAKNNLRYSSQYMLLKVHRDTNTWTRVAQKPVTHLELSQTSRMERVVKIINGLLPLTIFAKGPIGSLMLARF